MYRVVFYCPDTHIEYDGRTPYDVGVGGGVTARVRMARALQNAGNDVTVVANCPRWDRFDGVDYIPLRDCDSIETDVLVSNTSGGGMDLRPQLELNVNARLRILWVQGSQQPLGLDNIDFDFLYVPSNFLAGVVHNQWEIPTEKVFIAYNPFDEALFLAGEKHQPTRDPFRLIYLSHPDKGLSPAIGILTRLHAIDSRFHLTVFGGHHLWGQPEVRPPETEGLAYHGLIGQEQLALELLKSSFSLCLQTREEPFGMVVTESQRAGCIVIASKVGAYSEIIQHGENGYLIAGDPFSAAVQNNASSVIQAMSEDQNEIERIRVQAQSVPWSSERMARVWVGHWDWLNFLGKRDDRPGRGIVSTFCEVCGANAIRLDDGAHCLECGRYTPAA